MRIANMPGLLKICLLGAMTADYESFGAELEANPSSGSNRPCGDIYGKGRLSLKGRKPAIPPDDGLYRSGEMVAPVEESVEGG